VSFFLFASYFCLQRYFNFFSEHRKLLEALAEAVGDANDLVLGKAEDLAQSGAEALVDELDDAQALAPRVKKALAEALDKAEALDEAKLLADLFEELAKAVDINVRQAVVRINDFMKLSVPVKAQALHEVLAALENKNKTLIKESIMVKQALAKAKNISMK
jgi:trans-aconitate methyltransferase